MKFSLALIFLLVLNVGWAQKKELKCPDFNSSISHSKRIRVGIFSLTYGRNYRILRIWDTNLKNSLSYFNSTDKPNNALDWGFTLDYRFSNHWGVKFENHYAKRGFKNKDIYNNTKIVEQLNWRSNFPDEFEYEYGDYKFQGNYYLNLEKGSFLFGLGSFFSKVRGSNTAVGFVIANNLYEQAFYDNYIIQQKRRAWVWGGIGSITYLHHINNRWSMSIQGYYLQEFSTQYLKQVGVFLNTLGAEIRIMANLKSW